jgi:hypothetical protein
MVGDYQMKAIGTEIYHSEEPSTRGIVAHPTPPIPESLTLESCCIPPLL